jgi:molybdate transport system substrate-binding protein
MSVVFYINCLLIVAKLGGSFRALSMARSPADRRLPRCRGALACTGAQGEARFYAAASLTDVMAELAKRFDPNRGNRLVGSFGASNTLAQQIHEGAAPGVFISASAEWIDKLEGWGLVEPDTRVDLAGNALVVIVPKAPPIGPHPYRISMRRDSPASRSLILLPSPPASTQKRRSRRRGLRRIKTRVVAAQDVRTALTYVERGEAPVGIVYATDAAASNKVDIAFRVPSELHPRIVYPMVLVKGADQRSRAFHAFLQTPDAWAVFEKAGFTKP